MFILYLISDFTFENLKFRHKETYGTMTPENFEYSLTSSLLWYTRNLRGLKITFLKLHKCTVKT